MASSMPGGVSVETMLLEVVDFLLRGRAGSSSNVLGKNNVRKDRYDARYVRATTKAHMHDCMRHNRTLLCCVVSMGVIQNQKSVFLSAVPNSCQLLNATPVSY